MKRIMSSSVLISYPNGQDFPCLSEEKVHFASIDPILTTLVLDCLVKVDEYWSLVLLVGCVLCTVWHEIFAGSNCDFWVFSAIRKNEFPQIKIKVTAKFFSRKCLLHRVNIP